ncbi:MAG: hypothetical protein HQ553_00850 [Chloroflexi bacterium]|nr:hypothetical protein [Chloroflexota bacterium]
MAYYDPTGWIPHEDQLLPNVESKIKSSKRAGSKKSKRSKAFLPPYAMELEVLATETREIMRLSLTKEKHGKVSINLAAGDDVLRNGHFNHGYHHNPNDRDIRPPHHIHFPTSTYPSLDRHHTYAYPVKSNGDYLSALQKFCSDTNIYLHNASLPLLRR